MTAKALPLMLDKKVVGTVTLDPSTTASEAYILYRRGIIPRTAWFDLQLKEMTEN